MCQVEAVTSHKRAMSVGSLIKQVTDGDSQFVRAGRLMTRGPAVVKGLAESTTTHEPVNGSILRALCGVGL